MPGQARPKGRRPEFQALLRIKNDLFRGKISNKILANLWLFWEVEFWLNLANPRAFSGSWDFFHLAALHCVTK